MSHAKGRGQSTSGPGRAVQRPWGRKELDLLEDSPPLRSRLFRPLALCPTAVPLFNSPVTGPPSSMTQSVLLLPRALRGTSCFTGHVVISRSSWAPRLPWPTHSCSYKFLVLSAFATMASPPAACAACLHRGQCEACRTVCLHGGERDI